MTQDDALTHHRLSVAAAYRRLAHAAFTAAEVFSDPDARVDERDARRVVVARTASVAHAVAVLKATRQGAADQRAAS